MVIHYHFPLHFPPPTHIRIHSTTTPLPPTTFVLLDIYLFICLQLSSFPPSILHPSLISPTHPYLPLPPPLWHDSPLRTLFLCLCLFSPRSFSVSFLLMLPLSSPVSSRPAPLSPWALLPRAFFCRLLLPLCFRRVDVDFGLSKCNRDTYEVP